MYKKIIGILFSFSLLFVNSMVFADSEMCGKGLKQLVSELNLTADQKSKISPILDQLKTAVKNSASQMGDIQSQISQQVTSGNMDQSTVEGLIDKKTKLIGDIMKAKVAAKSQIITILDDQQKAQLQDKMKKLEEKMREKYSKCHDDD